MNEKNNSKRLKEMINDCEGKYKDNYLNQQYCPLIPIMMGKDICQHQAKKIIYVREDKEKYLVPRYECNHTSGAQNE